MTQPARRGGKIARKRKRRLGTLLFFVGLLAVLGGTFAIGALAGRLSLSPSAPQGSTAKTPARGDKSASAQQPELTFYRELTAPLTPPPATAPAPRADAKREAAPPPGSRSAERSHSPERAPDAPALELPARELERAQAANVGVAVSRGDGARYTVQVASYNGRAQADALRARLAGLGLDAYVIEGEAAGATRYRVRVGTYQTAEEARQAAARIAAQGQVAAYVTTR